MPQRLPGAQFIETGPPCESKQNGVTEKCRNKIWAIQDSKSQLIFDVHIYYQKQCGKSLLQNGRLIMFDFSHAHAQPLFLMHANKVGGVQ